VFIAVGWAQNAIWCIVCQVTGYFVCLHSRCWKQHCPLFASLHSQCHCLVTSLMQPTAIHRKSQLKHASLFLNYAEDYDIESVNQQIHSGTRWQRMREWQFNEKKIEGKQLALSPKRGHEQGRSMRLCLCCYRRYRGSLAAIVPHCFYIFLTPTRPQAHK